MENIIFTIGHSTLPQDKFINLLIQHNISAVCDVRSSPYSKFNPQYNKDTLSQNLNIYDIRYVFLGKELGARSEDKSCYSDGRVQYDALSKTELFQSGIERIRLGMQRGYKMALMCAEKDPLDCHRTVLVARHLNMHEFNISHILSDGRLEKHSDTEKRLVKKLNLNSNDFFLSEQDVINRAFSQQEEKIAYTLHNT